MVRMEGVVDNRGFGGSDDVGELVDGCLGDFLDALEVTEQVCAGHLADALD